MKRKNVRDRQWTKYMRYLDGLHRRAPYPATHGIPPSFIGNTERLKQSARKLNAQRFEHRYDDEWWRD